MTADRPQPATGGPDGPGAALEANRRLVHGFLERMAAQDREAIRPLLATDVTWHVPPSAVPEYRHPHRGVDAVLDLLTGAGGTFYESGSQAVTAVHLIADGDLVAAHFRMTARMTTGRPYDNAYVFVVRVEDGAVAEVWEHLDSAYFYAAADIEPAWLRA